MPRTRCWRWVVVVVGAAQVWLLPRLARGFSAGPGCGCPAVCTAAEGAPPGLCPLPPSFHSWEITRQLFNLGWGRPRLFRKKKVGMKSTVPPPPPAHTHHERGARIGFLEKILDCPVLLEAWSRIMRSHCPHLVGYFDVSRCSEWRIKTARAGQATLGQECRASVAVTCSGNLVHDSCKEQPVWKRRHARAHAHLSLGQFYVKQWSWFILIEQIWLQKGISHDCNH